MNRLILAATLAGALALTGLAIILVAAPLTMGLAFTMPHDSVGWLGGVIGSGAVEREARSVEPFHRVAVRGSTDVHITVGGTQSVEVEAQRNIASLIDTTVENGTLTVSTRRSYTTFRHTSVNVTVPSLDGMAVNGSSDVSIEGARGPSLDITIRGSGDVTASGSVDHLAYTSVGSGDGRLQRLSVHDAVVQIRGSGDARLGTTGTLDVEVYGSGDVSYDGPARIVRQVVRGSGSVSQN
jgi:hypothetical protein